MVGRRRRVRAYLGWLLPGCLNVPRVKRCDYNACWGVCLEENGAFDCRVFVGSPGGSAEASSVSCRGEDACAGWRHQADGNMEPGRPRGGLRFSSRECGASIPRPTCRSWAMTNAFVR